MDNAGYEEFTNGVKSPTETLVESLETMRSLGSNFNDGNNSSPKVTLRTNQTFWGHPWLKTQQKYNRTVSFPDHLQNTTTRWGGKLQDT